MKQARGEHYFPTGALPVTAVRVRRERGRTVSHPHDLTEQEHDHDFRELALVLRGGARQRLEEVDYPVRTGDVYVLQERSRHHFHDIDNLELINIMYDPARLPLPEERLRSMPGYCALFVVEPTARRRGRVSSRMQLSPVELEGPRRIAEAMVAETGTRRPGWEAALLCGLLELMIELSRVYQAGGDREDRDLRGLGDLISRLEHEAARPWTVAEMCRHAHMSRSTLMRAFRRTLGLPPIEYLIEKRLDLAQRLLRDTDRTVTEIALDCGFSDGNYFTRQFRLRRGTTPTAYRRG